MKMTDENKYYCFKCKREFNYTVREYGGYAIHKMVSLCPNHWEEYLEIINRYNRELNDWWGRKDDDNNTKTVFKVSGVSE